MQLLHSQRPRQRCCVVVASFKALTPDGANVARLRGSARSSWPRPARPASPPGRRRRSTSTPARLADRAHGQAADQWLKVRLIEGGPYLVDRDQVEAARWATAPARFQLRVSTATPPTPTSRPSSRGTLTSDGLGHWFTFPGRVAKYVQLFIRNSYNSTFFQMRSFQVYWRAGWGQRALRRFLHDPLAIPIVAWSWDFGDGATSTAQHPLHTFAAPGVYPVRLTVNANGLSNTDTLTYTVLRPQNRRLQLVANHTK